MEISPSGKNLTVVYEYILIHKDGSTWDFPTTKHIVVPFGNGMMGTTLRIEAIYEIIVSIKYRRAG